MSEERGKRLYLVVGDRVVYSGRVCQKVVAMRDRFWPDAVLTDEPPGDDTPIALVTLDGPVDGVFLWVVKCCPHCGKTHVHGGGPGDGDPRRLLTHRVAHCVEGECFLGYDLVEREEEDDEDGQVA